MFCLSQWYNFLKSFLAHKRSKKKKLLAVVRGGSRDAATFKMKHFVIIVNGWKPLTTITKHSILDDATALDPPLVVTYDICILKSCRSLTNRL